MKTKALTCAFAASIAAGVMLFPASNSEAEARPVLEGTMYKVDALHSGVFFSIRHMGVSNFVGRFNEFEGAFNLDWESPDSSMMHIEVSAGSVDTNNKKRDTHIRSNDFFNAKQFPKMIFEGTHFKKTASDHMEITGDLTFLGLTKEITVHTDLIGEGETRQGYKMGIDTQFVFNRTDFNNSTYVEEGALGDEVRLMVNFVGVRQDG